MTERKKPNDEGPEGILKTLKEELAKLNSDQLSQLTNGVVSRAIMYVLASVIEGPTGFTQLLLFDKQLKTMAHESLERIEKLRNDDNSDGTETTN